MLFRVYVCVCVQARKGALFLFVEHQGISNRLWYRFQMLPDASNGGLAIRESLCDTKAEELIHVVSFDHTSFSCLLPHAAAVRDGTSIKNMITEVWSW